MLFCGPFASGKKLIALYRTLLHKNTQICTCADVYFISFETYYYKIQTTLNIGAVINHVISYGRSIQDSKNMDLG
jgi:hypothetical protein